ncbi:glycerol-3-phosphate acyltransferase 1, mitochondrial [Trichonephila clavata]|uniref:Glycerol-3-phosphate acyltransferase 1, mitochondrial n=1 Tax=Trichonephila clavata TaxID=2740835 RepID=A0A8X6ICF8_TRICU|nr:glycerol-3-phosphate acyltransferase 1, mitochondrial [Trichonephila clavata]
MWSSGGSPVQPEDKKQQFFLFRQDGHRMADLIHNMQDVYKKWESRRPNFSSRGRRRDARFNSGSQSKGYNRNEYQDNDHLIYDRPADRRYKQRVKIPRFKLPKYEGLAQFKMAPCVVTVNKQRPFVGACCLKCLPISRASVPDTSVFSLSVFNVLHIPHFQSLDFNFVLNILNKNKKNNYPHVSSDVIQNEKINHAVEKIAENYQNDDESSSVSKCIQYREARNILESLKTSVSSTCLQVTSFFFHYVFNRIFSGILVHKGQIEILNALKKRNIPFVYLPLYRSNLDYVLISFILYMNSLKVPLVTVDHDLYIPVIGWLTRFLGALYIRKYCESDKEKVDLIQSAVIQSYLTECLKLGHNLEFFLKSSHSKSDELQLSRDLLSTIIDAVAEETVDDVLVSTVSISYEKIMEENFATKQLGESKTQGNFFTKLYNFWKMLHFNLGTVRINFGQPFSLQEFLQTYKQKIPEKSSVTNTPPSSPISSTIQEEFNKTRCKSVTNILTQHIIYDATCSTSLMSTQLVSFLFITKYRKGATQQQLQNSLDWLRGELMNKKYDAGFMGESLPVIKRAVELLGKKLISSETVDMEWTSSDLENNNVKVTVYKPVTQLPHVLELQYYSNYVVPVFLLDSMIANALYALVDVEICHFRHCDTVAPCSDIMFSFSDIIDELIEKDCLHIAGVGIMPNRNVYGKKSHSLSFCSSEDEDDDSVLKKQQLKINLTEESINHLEFLRSVLSPCIESYWLGAVTLLKLIDEIMEENILIQEMQLTAQEKLYKGLLAYEESFSADTFRNALRLFELWQIVEHYVQDGIKIVYLSDSWNCKERINDVIARVEEFRK